MDAQNLAMYGQIESFWAKKLSLYQKLKRPNSQKLVGMDWGKQVHLSSSLQVKKEVERE